MRSGSIEGPVAPASCARHFSTGDGVSGIDGDGDSDGVVDDYHTPASRYGEGVSSPL